MKSSLDLLTEHVWLFLHSYEKFNYTDISFLPPNTILQFLAGKDVGFGLITRFKPTKPHDYCLTDIVWNKQTWISKSGGAIDLYSIKSTDIIQVFGDLSLKWKKISDFLKEGEKEMGQIFTSIDELVEYESEFLSNIAKGSLVSSIEDYLSTFRENLYLRLIISHRKDEPIPYP